MGSLLAQCTCLIVYSSRNGHLFFSGNKYLHLLTDQRNYTLRIDLESFENERRYAEYSSFHVEGRVNKYRLTVDGYSGNAGKFSLPSKHKPFV